MVHLQLFGRFGVRVDGEPVQAERFQGRRTRSLIAFLATRRGSLVPKDVLVEALWGDSAPANPSGSLDVLASRARKALGTSELIASTSGALMLAGGDLIEVDAEIYAEAIVRGRNYVAGGQYAAALAAFQEALYLWGEPLPEEAYSRWAEPFRRECADLRLQALESGAQTAITLGNAAIAVELARGAVAAEPLREVSNVLLVTALSFSGDQVAALAAYDRFRTVLAGELGLDPSPDAQELQGRILRGVRESAHTALQHLMPEPLHAHPRATIARHGSGPMRARMLASMAMMAAGADDYGRASDLIDLALEEAGDEIRALAEALYAGSIVDMNLGLMSRGAQRGDEALAHFERLGDDAGIANILDGKAMATFMDGHIADGVAAFDRVARLFSEAGNLARVVTPLSTKGHGLVFMAQPADALEVTEEALAIAVSLGEPENEAYVRWHKSEALTALGRTDEGIESASLSLQMAESIGHREWTAAALRALGIARRASGDLEGAEQAHRRGLTLSEGIPLFETWHAANLGLTLIAGGNADDARPFVERACAGGPALGSFEARLADVKLAAAMSDAMFDARRSALAAAAKAAGYDAIVRELRSG